MWQAIIILICLGINAVLAASELAFVSISKVRLRHMAEEGSEPAQKVLKLRETPERVLSIIQLGITFVGIVAAAFGGAATNRWLEPIFVTYFHLSATMSQVLAILLFVVPYTFLSVVISELMPKSVALKNPKWIIFHTHRWLIIFDKIFSPLISLLEKTTKYFTHLLFSWVQQEQHEEPIIVGRVVRPYALNLAKIESKRIRDILVPWEKTTKLQKEDSLAEVTKVVIESKHTRLPVLDGNSPHGLLQAKEFLYFLEKGDEDWENKLLPLLTIGEEDRLIETLKLMQENRSHMCVVMKNSTPVGIVTLEDIIEEIFGEIYDESDLLK